MDAMTNRRPLRTRSRPWAQAAARLAVQANVSPNAISSLGVLAALGGAGGFVLAPAQPAWWLAGALAIQLRLFANMLDGMVALEGGRQAATGPLFNEAPDRIEDSVLLVAAGVAAGMAWLGWAAALLAMGTAYVRALGGSLGFVQDYCGPMAKQHRMALLTVGALGAAAFPAQPVMALVLAAIAGGAALTCVRRTARLARAMKGA